MAKHRTHRTHSIAFKRQVVEEYLAGETLHGLARRRVAALGPGPCSRHARQPSPSMNAQNGSVPQSSSRTARSSSPFSGRRRTADKTSI